MSKKAKIIPFNQIEKIAIVFGNGRSMSQVKGDADYIMNGGYYNMTTGKPVCHLKVNGTVHAEPPADDYWNDWGYTWNTNDIRLAVIPNDSTGKNHITATRLLAGSLGPTSKLQYSADKAGARQRTAMGLTKDGLILYCADTPTTPETLRDELVSMGAVSAIMLDGGGSSQCDFMGDTIYSSRRVNNYIAVWTKKEETEKGENTVSKKVVLDPGHGVETAGKRSPDGSFLEHEGNLDMAQRVAAILKRHGVTVVMTRTDENDVELEHRVKISNTEKPDLFVSIHSNAAGNGEEWALATGFGIYTSAAGEDASRNKAAKMVISRAKEAGIHLWGNGLFHEVFYVLKNTVAPAILIEQLFHDNRSDLELLKDNDFRDKLAEVISKGILDFLSIPWVELVESEEPAVCTCPWCGKPLNIVKG